MLEGIHRQGILVLRPPLVLRPRVLRPPLVLRSGEPRLAQGPGAKCIASLALAAAVLGYGWAVPRHEGQWH